MFFVSFCIFQCGKILMISYRAHSGKEILWEFLSILRVFAIILVHTRTHCEPVQGSSIELTKTKTISMIKTHKRAASLESQRLSFISNLMHHLAKFPTKCLIACSNREKNRSPKRKAHEKKRNQRNFCLQLAYPWIDGVLIFDNASIQYEIRSN